MRNSQDAKVIALLDRAAARDFADVCILAQRYTKPLLLARAAEVGGGFAIFADMLDTLSRLPTPIAVSPAEVSILREFSTRWATELRS